jgi:hypothetical protein
METQTPRKKKGKKVSRPMPIKWQEIIDVLPAYQGKITLAAVSVGYSPKYANTTLPGILKRDIRFCKALKAKQAEIRKKTGITEEKVINELTKLALTPIKKKDVNVSDKLSALDKLCKHLGLFERDNVQKQGLTLVEILAIVGVKKDRKAISLDT